MTAAFCESRQQANQWSYREKAKRYPVALYNLTSGKRERIGLQNDFESVPEALHRSPVSAQKL